MSSPRTLRPSRAGRWRALTLLLVHLAIAAHIGLWLASGRAPTLAPVEPSEAAAFASESIINTGLVFFALTILSTLVLGRWFCGWACHLVAVQDGCRWLLLKLGVRPRPLRSRWLALVPLLAAGYLFIWPVVPRLLAGESLAVRGTEFVREGFWDTFPPWLPGLVTILVCGAVAVYFLGAKGFCTYGCPYGAFYGLADRVAPGRIRVTDDCVQCGHCTAICSSNVSVSQEVHDFGMVVDPGCMKCMDCVSTCPEGALYFGFGRPALGARPRVASPRRRVRMPGTDELVAALACAFAYFAMRGFNQGSGLLLSVGVAVTFAGLAVVALRLARRRDVSLPGLALKRAGALRPAGLAVGATVLVTAGLAVPYGVAPEAAAWRARRAFLDLQATRDAWLGSGLTFGAQDVSADDAARGRRLVEATEAVRAGAWVRSQHNALRMAWGRLLTGDPGGAAENLRESLARGREHPRLWTLLGDALAREATGTAVPPPAALAAWASALGLDAGYVPATQRLAEFHRRRALAAPGDRQNLVDAVALLDRTLDAAPEAYGLYQARGLFRAELGDLAGAAEDLGRLLDASPELVEPRLQRAQLLGMSGRWDEALGCLDEAPAAVAADARLGELRQALLAARRGQ